MLERLEHVRTLLTASGHPADDAVLGIFSASGFADLVSEARRRRGGLILVDLNRLYGFLEGPESGAKPGLRPA